MINNRYIIFFLYLMFVGCSGNVGYSEKKIKWHQEKNYRWTKIKSKKNKIGFKEITAQRTNIKFKNILGKSDIVHNQLLSIGSGVTTGDIDNDGLIDIYFANLNGPNVLYKNLGNFQFKDITDSSDIALKNYVSHGVLFEDVDGDKDLDLLVTTNSSGTFLYLNNGNGHFTKDIKCGLDTSAIGGTTLSMADIDGDGDLDLYIAHYRDISVRDLYSPSERSTKKVVKKLGNTFYVKSQFKKWYKIIDGRKGPILREVGTKDELYLNKGGKGKQWRGFKKVNNLKKHFLNVNGEKIGLKRDWGLTARFEDINNDGLPDLYVCNDYWTPDRIWINQGKGIFKAIEPFKIRHLSFSSMSIAIGDINNDSFPDLFVTDMLSPKHKRRLSEFVAFSPYPEKNGVIDDQRQYTQNSLYLNRGDGTFSEISNYSRVSASGWSWGSKFLDLNLDGFEDIIVNTGYSFDTQDLDTQLYLKKKERQNPYDLRSNQENIYEYPPLKLENKIFKNEGNLKFTDVSKEWGIRSKDVSQGLALADLDNDGDLDYITNRLNERASIYKNTTNKDRIGVKLIGNSPNTNAIGAVLTLKDKHLQVRRIISGGDYLSGSDHLISFAAMNDENIRSLSIKWPDGSLSKIDSIKKNRIYEISQSAISQIKDTVNFNKKLKPIFKDISYKIKYKANGYEYNDFRHQPLLPLKISQEGPGIAWIDVNDDGRLDLIQSSEKGNGLAIFKNVKNNNFKQLSFNELKNTVNIGQTSVIGWKSSEGVKLIVGSSNYERDSPKKASAYIYTIKKDKIIEVDSISGIKSSIGPIIAGDYNGDGKPDLFIGGRVVPNKYPIDAKSRLFISKNNRFELDTLNTEKIDNLGLVKGAVFTDYDLDGDMDLLVSTEWASLKLYNNKNGVFHDVTQQVGLDKYKGWWNGITTGDFNNDGYPDIVVTNMGLNSRYHINPKKPLRLFYNNLKRKGPVDIVEAEYNDSMNGYVPIRHLYDFTSFPIMANGLNSHAEYSSSSLKKIIGPFYNMMPFKEINTLSNLIFLNKNGVKFSSKSLPLKAQLSTAFYAGVADYDNDGNEDIFLAQNFYGFPPDIPRMDAGRGLWLKGNGNGDFKAIPGQKSGIKIYGEQRGAALGDFNDDGKVDLAVTQHGNNLKLFKNESPKRGINVKLLGPKNNINAIGSSIRIQYSDGTHGPRREIQCGSGYWSNNSSTQIMGTNKDKHVKAIEIMWFDGLNKTYMLDSLKNKYIFVFNYTDNK